MPKFARALVWFRRDLRNFDHYSLNFARAHGEQVFCVFVFDPDILDPLPRADRRVDFILASVGALARSLEAEGGGLIVLKGRPADAIPLLAQTLQVDGVYANQDYEPAAKARDSAVARQLAALGMGFHGFKDQVIFHGDEVLTQAGKPYTVFTPYRNAWIKALERQPEAVLPPYPPRSTGSRLAPAPRGLQEAARSPAWNEAGVELLPSPKPGDLGFISSDLDALPITPGMAGAAEALGEFLPRMTQYHQRRDFPGVRGVSYLSVHLRFGTLSPRSAVRAAWESWLADGGEGARTWLNELIWRDFYFMILDRFPHVVEGAFRPEYDQVSWETPASRPEAFTAWCEGRTGYPIVDAAMRQLRQTGYMHNRLRMIAASFLTKDLGIHWQAGEAFFACWLNDFDLAANNGGWQWSASTGCDAQPWFRIFNPVTQSEKFDPAGHFIRRYVPELARLPDRYLHAPWKTPPQVLADSGLRLPGDYPLPWVDHDRARQETLARFSVVKGKAGE